MGDFLGQLLSKLNMKQFKAVLILVSIAVILYVGHVVYINHINRRWIEKYSKNPQIKSVEIDRDKILIQKFDPKDHNKITQKQVNKAVKP